MMKWYYCSLLSLTFCQPDVVCKSCRSVTPISRKPLHRPPRKRKPTFTVDSGATLHCINDVSLFKHYTTPKKSVRIITANKGAIYSEAIGTVEITLLDDNGHERTIALHNVAYSPHFQTNLISVRRLWRDSGIKTRFGNRNYFKSIHTTSGVSLISIASSQFSPYTTHPHGHETSHLNCCIPDLGMLLQGV